MHLAGIKEGVDEVCITFVAALKNRGAQTAKIRTSWSPPARAFGRSLPLPTEDECRSPYRGDGKFDVSVAGNRRDLQIKRNGTGAETGKF